jgi:hypothetical protein
VGCVGSGWVQMMTCSLVSKLTILVCDSHIAKMRTGSGRGALGLVPLFMWMAPDHESPKVNWHAATKAACSAAVPMSPWMSLSSGIQ